MGAKFISVGASRIADVAPRRNRLTKTFASGLAGLGNIAGFGGSPTTFLMIVPIEAPCYAVRLGFGNPYNATMTVEKASVVVSDSYGLAANINGSTNTLVVPTGGGTNYPMYFDNAGGDVEKVNTAGTTRSLALVGDSGNTTNAAEAFTLKWSDWVPVVSIPRADGGTQHLLFIYVAISGTGTCVVKVPGVGASSGNGYNTTPAQNNGRFIYSGLNWSPGDWCDSPSGSGFKSIPANVLFALQYATPNAGIQVVTNGDSLTAVSPDGYACAAVRAAAQLSTPNLPIEVASMAWGGTASGVYDPMLANNVGALNPSVVTFQPITRNEVSGSYPQVLGNVMAKALMYSDVYKSKTLWNIAGCEPDYNGNTAGQNAFIAIRNAMLTAGKSGGVAVMDGPSAIGDVTGGKPWNYLAGNSDDGEHPNEAGINLMVPLMKAALSKLVF